MNEVKRKQVEKDAATIEKAMDHYSGPGGAHFGFISYATGERQVFAGGNLAITGMCLGEAIATLIQMTPGVDADEFIEAVTETARLILENDGGQAQ